jgi:hypothetical protein
VLEGVLNYVKFLIDNECLESIKNSNKILSFK